MATFWYFTFKVTNATTGFAKEDKSVVCNSEEYFPAELVECWADEEFGENSEILITNVVEISPAAYERLAAKIGVD